jgi:hypothetical protein
MDRGMAVSAQQQTLAEFLAEWLELPQMAAGNDEALQPRVDVMKAQCPQATAVAARLAAAAFHSYEAFVEVSSQRLPAPLVTPRNVESLLCRSS